MMDKFKTQKSPHSVGAFVVAGGVSYKRLTNSFKALSILK